MYCPKCRAEFRRGYRKCHECDVALVKELPPEPTPEYVDMKTVFVASDEYELMVVKSRLESERIKCFTKDTYAQDLIGFGRISGFNVALGSLKLLVASKDVKKAKKILDAIPPPKKVKVKVKAKATIKPKATAKAKPKAKTKPKATAKAKVRVKKTLKVTHPLKKKKR